MKNEALSLVSSIEEKCGTIKTLLSTEAENKVVSLALAREQVEKMKLNLGELFQRLPEPSPEVSQLLTEISSNVDSLDKTIPTAKEIGQMRQS